jgi:hypothetical protein
MGAMCCFLAFYYFPGFYLHLATGALKGVMKFKDKSVLAQSEGLLTPVEVLASASTGINYTYI